MLLCLCFEVVILYWTRAIIVNYGNHPTCVYSDLNLKVFSVQGFTVGFMKRQFPGIALDDTKHFDGFLNGNYFPGCNVYVSAAANSCHSKGAWMTVFVHHTVPPPEEQAYDKLTGS